MRLWSYTVPCEMCDWYRRVGDAGSICATHEALSWLAHGLAIGAVLCRADGIGSDRGYSHRNCDKDCIYSWHPGCGRPAP
jgi:hypothetical protein